MITLASVTRPIERLLRPTEYLLKGNPEYHFVGEIKIGDVKKRRTWVHIQEGKLVEVVEISLGRFDQKGSARIPAYFTSVDEALRYFSERGVTQEIFEKIIKPNLGIEQPPSWEYH